VNYKEKYKRLVNELIKKSFPSIKHFKIFITENKIFKLRYSAITNYFIFCGWIILHPKARRYSKPALKGLLVHELSHLDIILRKSFLNKIKFAFKFIFTKKGRKDNETAADMLTIKKGYGKDLLKLTNIIEKQKSHIKNRAKKGYLTSRQIEEAIRKKK
jgi:hypothetical protein